MKAAPPLFRALLPACVLYLPLYAQTAPGQPTDPDHEDKTVVLPTFDVTESKPVGYGTTNAMGATRMNLPVKDTPMSIVTINRELIDDLGAQNGMELFKYASGTNSASTRTNNVVSMRGEELRPNLGDFFLDGLPFSGALETEFIDRLEFVKGPAGTLYGSHSLGGIINEVSKRPLLKPQTTLKASYDSIGNTFQGSIDTTGPLGDQGLAYRAVLVSRAGEFATKAPNDKTALYLYGSYSPRKGPGRIWGRYSYQHVKEGGESFDTFYDGAGQPSSFGADHLLSPVPAEANWKYHSFEAGFETAFEGPNSTWNVRLLGRYDQDEGYARADINIEYQFYNAANALIGYTSYSVGPGQIRFSDPGWVDIRVNEASYEAYSVGPIAGRPNKHYGAYLDVVGDFTTGPIKHKLLAYTQLTAFRTSEIYTNYFTPPGYEFSIVHPVYTSWSALLSNPAVAYSKSGYGDAYNFGVQDNLFLFDDRVILVGGARYTYAGEATGKNEKSGVITITPASSDWVYKAGAVVKPFKANDGVVLFYNYSETFKPLQGVNRYNGLPYKNLEGTANELGVKLELLKQGLILTTSVFQNENTNYPIRFFDPVSRTDVEVQNGTGKVKGWEADVAWQPNPNWSFLVALSDVDSKTPTGMRKRNVQNGFNYRAVGKYTFTDSRLKHLSLGAAVVDIADRAGDSGNTYVTKGYTTLDLFAVYDFKRWRAQLNINNALDNDGVESAIISSLAQTQFPRSARLSFQYNF